MGLALHAQTITVRGTVTDEDGQPVIGAAVIQKNAPSNGAVTAADGTFSLLAPQGTTLVVSSIGYKEVEVAAAPRLDVVLQDDNELLDEVVVVGYGVQSKVNLTGAISSVKSEDIQGRAIANLEQALQGKTPGVTLITTSAQPGAVPTVRIRGIASNGTSDPLYVVDGLLMDDISSIDPNSIESMEVLKDAASAAIYGAQAGN
ncbi:MAG: TonB-dependent receptor plug domain-containing protein, partial [Bacteroidales bacterium]|nr:TonB-dependent receptor plug domain-containing protein [Bacteroidales bacterium]